MKNTARRSGFTLIELLIVIALLGALAVGLLATIDPFEQLKKGRDTSMRNTVSELYNSFLRYYSTKAQFPWGTYLGSAAANTMTDDINELINAGELKGGFMQLAGPGNLGKITVNSYTSEQVAVCFQPESKSFQVDPNTMYDPTGGTSITNCKSAGTGGTFTAWCNFCIQ